MPCIHVTPLSRLAETVEASGATHLVTLINVATPVERPASIAAERHLFIGMSDILHPMEGHVLPGEAHVRSLIGFARGWDRSRPMVIHCWAGISRSTAAAFITACALEPGLDEVALAERLRSASPSATPNARLVAIADALLGRRGRMVDAITAIGRGADAFEGTPFVLALD
jgi:predicted protein tyrosine phosphatase